MLKKLLFISSLILFSINFNYVFAETNLIIPVKKPSLTDEEIKVKISKNILKPLKKPKKIEITAIKENKIVEIKKIKEDKKIKPANNDRFLFSSEVFQTSCFDIPQRSELWNN